MNLQGNIFETRDGKAHLSESNLEIVMKKLHYVRTPESFEEKIIIIFKKFKSSRKMRSETQQVLRQILNKSLRHALP